MNDHETQRIAAALHAARPDWPAASIATLIRKHLADRPRRDVFVALAWVASEPNSATPARVLESGPWWKAAGVEGSAGKREPFDPNAVCGTCSLRRERCRALWSDDHEFLSAVQTKAVKGASDTARVVEALRAELRPTATAAAADEKPIETNPNVQALRDALPTADTLPDERTA